LLAAPGLLLHFFLELLAHFFLGGEEFLELRGSQDLLQLRLLFAVDLLRLAHLHERAAGTLENGFHLLGVFQIELGDSRLLFGGQVQLRLHHLGLRQGAFLRSRVLELVELSPRDGRGEQQDRPGGRYRTGDRMWSHGASSWSVTLTKFPCAGRDGVEDRWLAPARTDNTGVTKLTTPVPT